MDYELNTRRHIRDGLTRLAPARRLGYLRRLCRLGKGAEGSEVRVTACDGTAAGVFQDVMTLSAFHGVPLERAARELEGELRKG